jgi:hypothetical protein
MSTGGGEHERLTWALALAPAASVAVTQAAALIYATLGGRLAPVLACIYALWAGAVAGMLAPVAIVVLRRRGSLICCVVSLAATALALPLGFAIWGAATTIACHGGSDCPFG